jgi:hypothetical protein
MCMHKELNRLVVLSCLAGEHVFQRSVNLHLDVAVLY